MSTTKSNGNASVDASRISPEYVLVHRSEIAPTGSELKSEAKNLSNHTITGVRTVTSGLPKQLNTTPQLSHCFRFRSTAPVSAVITTKMVACACGGIATVANNTFTAWASSYKIKKLVVWAPSSTTSVSLTDVAWYTGTSGQSKDQTATNSVPLGITNSSVSTFLPPPKSLCGDWILSSQTANLFEVILDKGCVIDLHVDYTLSNVISPVAQAVAVAVLGTVYYLALDGPISNLLVPVSLPTTA